MVEWDTQVFAPVMAVFGTAVTYIPATGLPFPLNDALFEESYRKVEILDDGSQFATEQPAMTVRLAEFPGSSKPRQNDRLIVTKIKTTFVVREVQPDKAGLAKLMLQEVNATP